MTGPQGDCTHQVLDNLWDTRDDFTRKTSVRKPCSPGPDAYTLQGVRGYRREPGGSEGGCFSGSHADGLPYCMHVIINTCYLNLFMVPLVLAIHAAR